MACEGDSPNSTRATSPSFTRPALISTITRFSIRAFPPLHTSSEAARAAEEAAEEASKPLMLDVGAVVEEVARDPNESEEVLATAALELLALACEVPAARKAVLRSPTKAKQGQGGKVFEKPTGVKVILRGLQRLLGRDKGGADKEGRSARLCPPLPGSRASGTKGCASACT